MTMQRAYRIAGTLLLLLASLLVYESLQLTYFTSIGPGPGFFPFWLSLILGALAVGMLVQTFTQRRPMSLYFPTSRVRYLRMAAVVLSLALAAPLIETLGFRLTTLAMYVFLLGTLGRHRLIVTVPIALAGSFGAHYVFVHWLSVPLPVGIFGL
ncbi:tripartite tricarboxylate transporter TctB family protein [Shumkonia mesophila]|uniref:tripartite tricarboxylate transporter TctB family protein n=1 Tax=Shumkonia mesophila TaxID=2838854 RepID=UPI002934EF9A|nr:tripartite tricarboxylate transporter TctB family protein [Shumkonia mesophila]